MAEQLQNPSMESNLLELGFGSEIFFLETSELTALFCPEDDHFRTLKISHTHASFGARMMQTNVDIGG